MQKHLSVSEF